MAAAGRRQRENLPAVFSFHRKLLSYEMKNAPRGSYCGGKEDVACATRRRRRILQSRILSCAKIDG